MSKIKFQEYRERIAKRLLTIMAVLFIGGFALGFEIHVALQHKFNPPKIAVSETYTVKPCDTFWQISKHYRDMDCRDPYIFTYQDELRVLNPKLVANKNQLYVGQELNIVYYELAED